MAAILKNVKSPYLRSHLTDFNEIWHVYANWPPTGEVSFYIYDRPLTGINVVAGLCAYNVWTKFWYLLFSVWSKVQTCIRPSWCHCHSLSLAPVKSRLVLPFWYRLTWVVPYKGPLNECVCVYVCAVFKTGGFYKKKRIWSQFFYR